DPQVTALTRPDVPDRGRDEPLASVGAPLRIDGADLEAGIPRRRKRRLGDRRLGRLRSRGCRRRATARDEQRSDQQRNRDARGAQDATSAAALERTASPRSVFAVRTIFPGASCHMSVVIVSPGYTTPEKRTSN